MTSQRTHSFHRLNLIAAAVFAVAALAPRQLLACSCMPPPRALVAMGESDAVFSGTVVSRRDPTTPRPDGTMSSMDPMEYTFSVLEVWKGDIGDSVAVRTARMSASCGYPFRVGGRYLVYATERGGLRTNLCTRTKSLSHAYRDIEELNSLGVRGAAEEVNAPILDHFVVRLYSGHPDERAQAAEGLGTMGLDREVVMAELSALYERGTPSDRQAAVKAIGRYAMLSGGASEALPVLLAGLDDESEDVRVATFFPVSRLQSVFSATVPAVVTCLGDTSAKVREGALRTLNTMTRHTDVPDAAHLVEDLLSNEDKKVRSQAVGLLPKLVPQEEAFEAISPLADDESALVRSSVVYKMTELAFVPEEAEAILVRALADTAEKVRKAAVSELCDFQHGGPRAVRALVGAHNDGNWQIRKNSVRALAAMIDRVPEALDALMEAVNHEQTDVREEAIVRISMSDLDPEFKLDVAEGALEDPEWDVQRRAMHVFERLGPESPAAIAALIRTLQAGDPNMRAAAAAMLGRAGAESTAAFDALTEALTDEDQLVRTQAVDALRRIEHTLSSPDRKEEPVGPGKPGFDGGR